MNQVGYGASGAGLDVRNVFTINSQISVQARGQPARPSPGHSRRLHSRDSVNSGSLGYATGGSCASAVVRARALISFKL